MSGTHSSNSRSRPRFTRREATAVTGGSSSGPWSRALTNSSIKGVPKVLPRRWSVKPLRRTSCRSPAGIVRQKITHLGDTPAAEVGYVSPVAGLAPSRGEDMADQGITLGDTPRSDGLDEAVFEDLRANFRGELLRSRDDGYHVARAVFNGMIDRR